MPKAFPRNAKPDQNFNPAVAPDDEIRKEFARGLQAALIDKGWNQAELGRRSGQGRDSISGYIRGKRLPGTLALSKMAAALGVEPSYLLPASASRSTECLSPAFEVRPQKNKLWLRINQSVTWEQAEKVWAILDAKVEE